MSISSARNTNLKIQILPEIEYTTVNRILLFVSNRPINIRKKKSKAQP